MGLFDYIFRKKYNNKEQKHNNSEINYTENLEKTCNYIIDTIKNKWIETNADDSQKRNYVSEIMLKKYYQYQNNKENFVFTIRAFEIVLPKLFDSDLISNSFMKDTIKYGIEKGYLSEDEGKEIYIQNTTSMLANIRKYME